LLGQPDWLRLRVRLARPARVSTVRGSRGLAVTRAKRAAEFFHALLREGRPEVVIEDHVVPPNWLTEGKIQDPGNRAPTPR
jgi:hypothetical protein